MLAIQRVNQFVVVIVAGVSNTLRKRKKIVFAHCYCLDLLGLVFPKAVGSSTVYFLRGIVSTGGNKGGSCDNDKYTLFTNVQYHIEMVQYYETQNRPK